jgi:ribosomal protein L34E
MIKSRSLKRFKIKTPSGKAVIHYKNKKLGKIVCSICGAKLKTKQSKKLPRSKKVVERPFSNLCLNCLKIQLKNKARVC